jgi:hypothetical protein
LFKLDRSKNQTPRGILLQHGVEQSLATNDKLTFHSIFKSANISGFQTLNTELQHIAVYMQWYQLRHYFASKHLTFVLYDDKE